MTASKPSKPRRDAPADPAGLTYEQAMAELELIIDRIESGEIGLEESLAAYERGVALRARCQEILDRAEQRVSELTPPKAGARADEGSDPGGTDAAEADDDTDER